MDSSPPDIDIDAWLTGRRFGLLLAGLIALCFPEVIMGGKSFFLRDFGAFGYPLALWHRESFWRGEMPLWNPLNNCGLPFLAQWNTLTLYPPSFFYLLFPLPWSLCVFNLFHLFLAGLGMYFLARRWTGSRVGAAVAGIVFAFNGLNVYALMWPNNIAALGWMPWAILAAEKVWHEGGSRLIIVAAIVCAMQMLAGAPEVIIQTWGIIGALWLARLVWPDMAMANNPEIQGALNNARPPLSRGQLAVSFLSLLLLTVGLSAAQLLPFLDLLVHSQRSAGFADASWAMPGTGWANYLVPLFDTTPARQGQYWVGSYYVGAATVALAMLAVWLVRGRRVWILFLLAVGSLIMAMGDNSFFYPLLRRILPQLGFMRFPIKFVVTTTFVFPALAAFALAWLRTAPAAGLSSARAKVASTALVLLGLMAVITWFGCEHGSPASGQRNHDRDLVLNACVRAVFFVAILGSLPALRRIQAARSRAILIILALLMFWFDLFTHVPSLAPAVEPLALKPDFIRQNSKSDFSSDGEDANERALTTASAFSNALFHSLPDPVNDIAIRRLALFCNYNLLDHAAKVDGFFSLYLRESAAVNHALQTTTNELPLMDFLGVSRISAPINAAEWTPRNTYMPLLTAGQAAVFADDAAAFRHVCAMTFKPRDEVFLPAAAQASIVATNRTDAKIVSRHFSSQRLTALVDAPAPSMVVVAQAFYYPWQARVDGRPVPLWRANYAYQALQIPAGRHQVSLDYEDRAFCFGACISALALLVCGLGYVKSSPPRSDFSPTFFSPRSRS